VADVYSSCAVEVGKRADARTAQDNMRKLFQTRRLVDTVIAKVEARLGELTRAAPRRMGIPQGVFDRVVTRVSDLQAALDDVGPRWSLHVAMAPAHLSDGD
jgi:hypothetical protein